MPQDVRDEVARFYDEEGARLVGRSFTAFCIACNHPAAHSAPTAARRASRSWDYCGFDRQAYLRHLLAAIGAADRTEMLASVRAPTLVLQGTEDPVQSMAAAEAQANAIRGAELRPVRGMGHDILAEHLPEVTDLFLSFLRGI